MAKFYQPPKRQIFRDIVDISRCAISITDRIFEEKGLTRGQNSYMIRILEEPGCTQNELARKLCVNKTAVTKAITLLEKQGYIVRQRDAEDMRKYSIVPTSNLEPMYYDLQKPLSDLAQNCFEEFTEEEVLEYKRLTEKLKRIIKKTWYAEFGYDEALLEKDMHI